MWVIKRISDGLYYIRTEWNADELIGGDLPIYGAKVSAARFSDHDQDTTLLYGEEVWEKESHTESAEAILAQSVPSDTPAGDYADRFTDALIDVIVDGIKIPGER
jgi:hypothetical protein